MAVSGSPGLNRSKRCSRGLKDETRLFCSSLLQTQDVMSVVETWHWHWRLPSKLYGMGGIRRIGQMPPFPFVSRSSHRHYPIWQTGAGIPPRSVFGAPSSSSFSLGPGKHGKQRTTQRSHLRCAPVHLKLSRSILRSSDSNP